jgi:hypothetical protein
MADVTEHSIEEHIQPFLMRLVDQLLEFVIATELRIDVEEVTGKVAGGIEFLVAAAGAGESNTGVSQMALTFRL